MVNYKELLKRKLARLTPEEKAHRAMYLEMKKSHLYYEGSCKLVSGIGAEIVRVRLYSHVNYHTLEVGSRVLVEFVGSHPYCFDRRMVEGWLKTSQEQEVVGFYVDEKNGLYVPQKEMDRIMMECMGAVISKGVRYKWEN